AAEQQRLEMADRRDHRPFTARQAGLAQSVDPFVGLDLHDELVAELRTTTGSRVAADANGKRPNRRNLQEALIVTMVRPAKREYAKRGCPRRPRAAGRV